MSLDAAATGLLVELLTMSVVIVLAASTPFRVGAAAQIIYFGIYYDKPTVVACDSTRTSYTPVLVLP